MWVQFWAEAFCTYSNQCKGWAQVQSNTGSGLLFSVRSWQISRGGWVWQTRLGSLLKYFIPFPRTASVSRTDTHPRPSCPLTPSTFVQIPKIRRAPSCRSERRRRRARGALLHASKLSSVLFPAEANGCKRGRQEQPVQALEHQQGKPSQERTHGGCMLQWHFKKNRFESWAWSLHGSGHPPSFPESNVNCLRKRPPPAPQPGTVPPSHTLCLLTAHPVSQSSFYCVYKLWPFSSVNYENIGQSVRLAPGWSRGRKPLKNEPLSLCSLLPMDLVVLGYDSASLQQPLYKLQLRRPGRQRDLLCPALVGGRGADRGVAGGMQSAFCYPI